MDEKGRLDLETSLVYDVGWQITDKAGNVYNKRSFVVDEIFNGCADIMKTAYFAEKIPQYIADIEAGTRIVAPLDAIRRILISDMERYNTNVVFAHNALFDLKALNTTLRYITTSRKRWFFPVETEFWDTLKMSQLLLNKPTYVKFCENNGYMTKHRNPRPRMTAEVIWRYITNDITFEESHTGLEDVEIETQILAYLFRQKKKMTKLLFDNK